MKQAVALLVLFSAVSARAEFGVSAGASFNYKADFSMSAQSQTRATDPDNTDNRTYDDGYVRTDDIPGYADQTRFYGYDTADGADISVSGELTLHSSQTILDAQKSSGGQSEAQPAVEIYWQQDLTENENWNFGLRAAVRWQRVELDNTAMYSATVETISDTYTYSSGALLTDSYDGYPTPTAGYPTLGDTYTSRDITYASGAGFAAARELEADLFGFDFGPTLSFDFTDTLRLSASAGGTVAWIHSDFSYTDGSFASGRGTKEDWLWGAYASADLQYKLGEHWGIFGGVAYVRLEDFEQQVDGRVAELQFDDSYTLRAGIFIR